MVNDLAASCGYAYHDDLEAMNVTPSFMARVYRISQYNQFKEQSRLMRDVSIGEALCVRRSAADILPIPGVYLVSHNEDRRLAYVGSTVRSVGLRLYEHLSSPKSLIGGYLLHRDMSDFHGYPLVKIAIFIPKVESVEGSFTFKEGELRRLENLAIAAFRPLYNSLGEAT